MTRTFLVSLFCIFSSGALWSQGLQFGSNADETGDLRSLSANYAVGGFRLGASVREEGWSVSGEGLWPIGKTPPDRITFLGADVTLSETQPNAGAYLGHRRALLGRDSVVGVWTGLDATKSINDNTFTRGILGGEYFGRNVHGQVNFFNPIRDTANGAERTYRGFDWDLSYVQPVRNGSAITEWRLIGGGAYFDRSEAMLSDVHNRRIGAEVDFFPFERWQNVRATAGLMHQEVSEGGRETVLNLSFAVAPNPKAEVGLKPESASEPDYKGGPSSITDPVVVSPYTATPNLYRPVRRNKNPLIETVTPSSPLVCGEPTVPWVHDDFRGYGETFGYNVVVEEALPGIWTATYRAWGTNITGVYPAQIVYTVGFRSSPSPVALRCNTETLNWEVYTGDLANPILTPRPGTPLGTIGFDFRSPGNFDGWDPAPGRCGGCNVTYVQ